LGGKRGITGKEVEGMDKKEIFSHPLDV